MKTLGTVSVQEVMAEIHKPSAVFSLGFVRATGKLKGSIKYMPKVRKGATNPHSRSAAQVKHQEKSSKSLHRFSGTLPFTDLETGRYMTILISHIIIFNNKQVIH